MDDLVEEYLDLDDGPITKSNTSLERLAGRILNVHEDYTTQFCNPKFQKDKNKYTDRANRAVSEQVLDPRIRAILLKFINNGLVYEINGCISTGKEANVYHAVTENGEHRAIKIYKSTILTFKNRDRYVTGEYRFRNGYAKSNPRKMTAMWAEKEMRNLKRLEAAGIPCPTVFHLKAQVLLMDFIPDETNGEWPAPRLKDVENGNYPSLYKQCLRMMRKLFHECHLVHADLSEYNLLVTDVGEKLVMIDVGQSVEHEHPNALAFLRHDCKNIIHYFRMRSISTPSVKGLFEFVISSNVDESDEGIYNLALKYPEDDISDEQFESVFLPRNIEEINEREPCGFEIYEKMAKTFNQSLSSIDLGKNDKVENVMDNNEEELDSASNSDSFTSSVSLSKEEAKEQKKLHKATVKEENRIRRQTTKIPKFIKKKATKKCTK